MTIITTYTGKHICPINIQPQDLCVEDVARGLSNTCRFGGQLRKFYSVAQHSVICAEQAIYLYGDKELELACLLHDLAEAYLGDILKPIKDNMAISTLPEGRIISINEAEDLIINAFCAEHNLKLNWEDSRIKLIDNLVLNSESYYFRGFQVNEYPLLKKEIEPLCPKDAYVQYMNYVSKFSLT